MQYFGFDRPSFAFKTYSFGANFDPLDLFVGGMQGVWYDPSDKSTLFKDAAGVVPVTKDGDPVGLRLDKSKGLATGVDLISNGDYSSGLDGWTAILGTIELGEGGLILTGDDAINNHQANTTVNDLEVGATYLLEYEVLKLEEGSMDVGVIILGLNTLGFGLAYSYPTKLGLNKVFLKATKVSGDVRLHSGTQPYARVVFGKVKLQKISGNHATQTVSAARPTYKTDSTNTWLDYDKTDDTMFVGLPTMTATVIKATDEGVSINYPVSIAAGDYPITSTSALGRDYGHLIINKELSVSEITQVTNYFNAKRGI